MNKQYLGWMHKAEYTSYTHVIANSEQDANLAVVMQYADYEGEPIEWFAIEYTEQLTIGQICDKLESLDEAKLVKIRSIVPGEWMPERYLDGNFDSSRGSYVNLAIGWTTSEESWTVGDLYEQLTELAENAVVFEGYKGGNYRMTRRTLVDIGWSWTSTGLGVVDVVDEGDIVWLIAKGC